MNTFFKLFLFSCLIINFTHGDETIELSCTSHDDCKSFEDKAIQSLCESGLCSCSIRRPEVNQTAKVDCKPRASMPNLQNLKECPCTRPNTVCINDKCECSKDFQETKDGRCIALAVNLEKKCENHDQCRQKEKFSECADGICKCVDLFHPVKNSCRSVVSKAKSNCVNTSDCGDEQQECLDTRCVCKENFVASKNPGLQKCLPLADHGEKCDEPHQCTLSLGSGSICANHTCVCDENHTKFNDDGQVLCRKKILVGDHCQDHNECVPYKGEAKMICSKNKCVCNEGYELFDAYQKKCSKVEFRTSSSTFMESIHVFLTLILVYVVSKVLM